MNRHRRCHAGLVCRTPGVATCKRRWSPSCSAPPAERVVQAEHAWQLLPKGRCVTPLYHAASGSTRTTPSPCRTCRRQPDIADPGSRRGRTAPGTPGLAIARVVEAVERRPARGSRYVWKRPTSSSPPSRARRSRPRQPAGVASPVVWPAPTHPARRRAGTSASDSRLMLRSPTVSTSGPMDGSSRGCSGDSSRRPGR